VVVRDGSEGDGTVKLLRRGSRTEGVSERCEYYVRFHQCKEPSAGEMRAHQMVARQQVPWGMCAEHVRPECHPPDLREHLYPW
jgi:hypothetical protein